MEQIKTHKDLDVWKQAIELATQIYHLTERFPRSEEFGMKFQIRRAVVSIPTNISEGAARNSTKEFTHFLRISLGSLSELETLLIISEKLKFIGSLELLDKVTILRRMILKLITSLRNK